MTVFSVSVLFRFTRMNERYYERRTSLFQVVVGAHVLRDLQQRFSVKRAVKHELYVPENHMYDIMLFQLSSKMNFSKNVRPICVNDAAFAPGTQCVVTGWGSINATGNSRYIGYSPRSLLVVICNVYVITCHLFRTISTTSTS